MKGKEYPLAKSFAASFILPLEYINIYILVLLEMAEMLSVSRGLIRIQVGREGLDFVLILSSFVFVQVETVERKLEGREDKAKK